MYKNSLKPLTGRSGLLRRGRAYVLPVVAALVLLATIPPLISLAENPWPGFFYSPFYTNNVFSDPTTPAWQAGLRPEDRVIQVEKERIDRLQEITGKIGKGNRLYVVYELGQSLTSINIEVESGEWLRLLEKAGPFFLSGAILLVVAFRSLRKNSGAGWLALFSGLVGIALLAAPDFFLGPGNGRESGFEPFLASWPVLTAKWSTFVYRPLWSIALAAGWLWATGLLLKGPRYRKWRAGAWGFTGLLLFFDMALYLGAAVKTATYNNPDYVTWHSRGEFWPAWLGFVLLVTLAAFRSPVPARRWRFAGLLGGLALAILGFAFPVVFDIPLPGPGPQWWSLGFGSVFFLIKDYP